MRVRVSAPVIFALISLLLCGAMVAWLAGPVDQADDAVAFGAALLGIVALPVLLAAAVAGLVPRADRAMRFVAVGAVAGAGLAGTAPLGSIMRADDPKDPAWIGAFVWAAPFALLTASVLAGVVLFRLLPGGRMAVRVPLTVPLAVVSAVVIAFVACQTIPAMLGAVALPIVLLVMAHRRRRTTPSAA